MRRQEREKHHCKSCDYTTSNKNDYTKHLLTRKHKKVNNLDGNSTKSIEKTPTKITKNFTCEKCNFITNKQSDYERHINTQKHLQNSSEDVTKPTHTCDICKKQYSNYNSLWKHKRKCVEPTSENVPLIDMSNNIIMEFLKTSKEMQIFLIEQNKDLQNKLLEMAKNQNQTVTVTNTNTNCNNNQFNLNFFLNETCKDAINMVEFVNTIKLQLEDLEETARVGYVEGISRIFVKALNDMEVNKRPIHCTDIKRETVYVKNNDNWEKDNPEKKNLKKAVEYIANKNMQQINDWKEENPNWQDVKSEESQVLNKMYMTTMGGVTEDEDKKYVSKIIKNILHEVVVEKES